MNKLQEYPDRTRFKDIVSEFFAPVKPSRKVIILLGGMPGYPRRTELMHRLARQGYWVFNPRYRGTWESGGLLFRKPVEQDVFDILDGFKRGFKNLWTGKTQKIAPTETILWGTSFGGAVALLASKDPRVTKAVVISPLIDWQDDSEDEPMDKFIPYLTEAFGMGYRIASNGWAKIGSGRFFNPAYNAGSIDGKKLLIIHAEDDRTCPFESSLRFAERTGAKFVKFKKGGHSLNYLELPALRKIINRFINKK